MTTDPSDSSIQQIQEGTVLGGKFRVIRLLGQGGMGAVFEVKHEITHHHRALKLLHAHVREVSPQVVARFLKEASVAGTLGNEHIVEVYDAGNLPSGEPYVLMELLKGQALSSLIEAKPLSSDEVLHIMVQLCEAVGAAHARGIVHRDLKPDNVFLVEKDAQKHFVKVLDFGISKFESKSGENHAQTQEGTMLGTPYYMSPEQIRGATDVDGRTDVYALGVIMYEALTGRRPFEADTLSALAIKIHEGEMPPLRSIRPDVTLDLERVISQAMHRDRNKRTQSAVELRRQLLILQGHQGFDSTAVVTVAPDGLRPKPAVMDTQVAIAPAVEVVAKESSEEIATPAQEKTQKKIPSWVFAVASVAVATIGVSAFLLGKNSDAAKQTQQTMSTSNGVPTQHSANVEHAMPVVSGLHKTDSPSSVHGTSSASANQIPPMTTTEKIAALPSTKVVPSATVIAKPTASAPNVVSATTTVRTASTGTTATATTATAGAVGTSRAEKKGLATSPF